MSDGTDRARAKLNEMSGGVARGTYVPAEYFAIVHLGLGEPDTALDQLEKALAQNSTTVVFLGIDPMLDPVRDHRRFTELLRRANLPIARPTVR